MIPSANDSNISFIFTLYIIAINIVKNTNNTINEYTFHCPNGSNVAPIRALNTDTLNNLKLTILLWRSNNLLVSKYVPHGTIPAINNTNITINIIVNGSVFLTFSFLISALSAFEVNIVNRINANKAIAKAINLTTIFVVTFVANISFA